MLEMMLIIPLLATFAAFLFVFSLLPSKNALERTIEVLEARRPEMNEEAASQLEKALAKMVPAETAGNMQRALLSAGWYTTTPAKMFARIVSAAAFATLVLLLAFRFLHVSGPVWYILLLTLWVAITYSPLYWLNRAAELRKLEVQRALPDFLDMVASTVGAGLAMNAALAYAVDTAPGALGNEVNEALSEIRLGRSRTDALKAAAGRLNQQEFSTTIAAITQAERLGANVGKILNELADDTRNHRMMLIETEAAKLPVKMVFPMAFFLLPALMVLIFGTLVANYLYQPHL
ncbi:MAG TPA: type II secretion system F family protein [Candidatus Baltobacteraceae bacterium]|nr:type II secretion system F family protein [Candidatus Baltobacteraceae bacterium]